MFVEIPDIQITLLPKPSAVPSPIWHQVAAVSPALLPTQHASLVR